MNSYEPEIGQMIFGNRWGPYEAPNWLIAMLAYLDEEICRVEWNIQLKEYESPFGNIGGEYETDYFTVRAYWWGEDCDCEHDGKTRCNPSCRECQPNFEVQDTPSGEPLEVRWYKHLRRGTTVNRQIEPSEMAEILDRCLATVRFKDKEHFEKLGLEGE